MSTDRGTEAPPGTRLCSHCQQPYTRTIWHHLETCPDYTPRDLEEIATDLDELGYPAVAAHAHDLVREAAVVLHRLGRRDPRALELAAAVARRREGQAA